MEKELLKIMSKQVLTWDFYKDCKYSQDHVVMNIESDDANEKKTGKLESFLMIQGEKFYKLPSSFESVDAYIRSWESVFYIEFKAQICKSAQLEVVLLRRWSIQCRLFGGR